MGGGFMDLRKFLPLIKYINPQSITMEQMFMYKYIDWTSFYMRSIPSNWRDKKAQPRVFWDNKSTQPSDV